MMASTRGRDNPSHLIEKACCKCSKSEEKMGKHQHASPYFENAVTKFEERRGGLVNRQQYLRQKVTTMERSIPALIAYNMLKGGENSEDSPLCRVKEMMKKLAPHRDPTDRLLDKLQTTVKSLNGETAELHDKIIEADIKLEESEMELESLQLANKELEERLTSLEKEVNAHKTPSLHSIYSDDLICLSKIRQLGEAEINLKNSIRELEERESLFHRQMDRILKSKEFRKASCGGIDQKIRQLECNERKMHCDLQSQKCSVQQLKKKMLRTERELANASGVENQSRSTKERPDKEINPTKVSNPPSNVTSVAKCQVARSALPSCSSCMSNHSKCLQPSVCSLKLGSVSMASKSNVSKGKACAPACQQPPTLVNPPCKIAAAKTKEKPMPCPSMLNAVSGKRQTPGCSSGTLCTKCQGLKVVKPCSPEQPNPTDCHCSCKGKCATGTSGNECTCALYLNAADKEGNEQSSTDEEYCECCDCSCDDSESDTT